jgi:hypothetical protein
LQAASVCVEVPVVSTVHWPVAPPQTYTVGAGGTHVVVQLVFDSVPDPGEHTLVAGSLHVYCPHAVLHSVSDCLLFRST